MNKHLMIEQLKAYTDSLEKYVNEKQIDSSIAQGVSDFLNGYVNKLPRFSALNSVIDSTKLGSKISEGYGVTIYTLENTEEKCYEIIVDMITIIDDKRRILYKITSDKVETKFINGKICIDSKADKKTSSKFKNVPRIEEKRIEYLQYYLNNFGKIEYRKENTIK